MHMGWSVNKICTYIFAKFQFAVAVGISSIPLFLDLDPEKWDDLRKGLDYNEAPLPEMQSGDVPAAPPVGLGIWMEMLKIVGIIILIILIMNNMRRNHHLGKNKNHKNKDQHKRNNRIDI